jgi:hypothetical protein
MPFDAFISYSSKDKVSADAACAMLESAGVRCWIAPRDILPGGEYGAAIIDAIDQCRLMVLIFSSNANDSRQIHREIERAVAKGVPIVPVRIEEVAPTRSMEYFLGAIHWLDALTPPIEKHLHQLSDTVKAILQADASHSPLDERERPGSRFDRPALPPRAANRSGGTADSLSKTPARAGLILAALAGGIGVVTLLAAGAWLYQRNAPAAPPSSSPAPAQSQAQALVPEAVPFISDGERALLRNSYLGAPDHKALAISSAASFVSGQKDDETAKTAALQACKRGVNANYCQIYAVGTSVVFAGGAPQLPPQPWLVRDASVERPLVARDLPLLSADARAFMEKTLPTLRNPKAIAIGEGAYANFSAQTNTDEAVRRSLEWCGMTGTACVVVAVDDVFVVPVPATMRVTGLFHAGSNGAIAAEMRPEVALRLANATSGWNVVAVGANGRPGLALRAAKERDGTEAALADCHRQDRECRVIAIGPFLVEPPNPASIPAPAQPTTATVSVVEKSMTLARSAKSGIDSPLAYSGRWDHDCKSLPLKITITKNPMNGTVTVVDADEVLQATTPASGSTGACIGKTIRSKMIRYLSPPGFRGSDTLGYDSEGEGTVIHTTIAVTVE